MRGLYKILLAIFVALSASSCFTPTLQVDGGGVDPEDAEITFSSHVGNMISENCISCHATGAIAPFSLESYDDVKARSAWILQSIKSHSMPPSNVDNSGSCNVYTNSRWLSDSQVETFEKWIAQGEAQGDSTYRMPASVSAARLDRVDHTLSMSTAYTPTMPGGQDEYRCFILEQPITSGPSKMVGFEVIPGDVRIVHHATVMSFNTSAAETAARALDAADPGLGFSCFGGVTDTTPFGIWAAGGSAFEYPQGKGFDLPLNRAFVMQVHYSGLEPGPDLTTINLKLESTVDQVEIFFISSISMSIAQGLVNYRADGDLISGIPVNGSGELVIPAGLRVRLIATFPHMHKLGKAMDVKFVKYASGANPQADVCLAQVTNWNFNWQDTYVYKDPIILRAGTYKPQISCYYDSTRNWPVGRTAPITFGENSEDEMCMAFFHYTIEYDI